MYNKLNIIVYQKYLVVSIKKDALRTVYSWAQVQRLNESRLTIRWDGGQGIVAFGGG